MDVCEGIKRVAQINDEFNLLKDLDHPNIVRLIEAFTDMNYFCLVTELCKGRDLISDLKMRKSYSETEAAFIIWQIIIAVSYCHKRDVCHRDIKLDNIIVDDRLSIKLIDFGFAKKWRREFTVSFSGISKIKMIRMFHRDKPSCFRRKFENSLPF